MIYAMPLWIEPERRNVTTSLSHASGGRSSSTRTTLLAASPVVQR